MGKESQGLKRVLTGIPGLDRLLEGGLLNGGVYIVQGPPGSGKTILGNQICFQHAAAGGQALYVTLLAESHTRMLAHLRRMSFFDAPLIPERLYYISAFKILEAEGLEALSRTLRNASIARNASLLVVDGLRSAEELSPSEKAYKKFFHELQSLSSMIGCTILLLKNDGVTLSLHPEHPIVDGIIELSHELIGLRSVRHLQIKKLRGAAQVAGKHTIEISDEGIVVWPRLETQPRLLRSWDGAVTPGPERLGFGLAGLDEMLHGGVPGNSVTMILGPSGIGKTTLGLHFLAEGVHRGEPGVYFGFYERPESLLCKSEQLGLGLADAHARGLVVLSRQERVEGVIDILGDRLLELVRRYHTRRLCIDGIHGFELADSCSGRIRNVFAALTEELEALAVTTVYTMEMPDIQGARLELPIQGVSAVTQNSLLLRYIERQSRVHRQISVIKVRDSDYDATIREFRITEQGIVVEPQAIPPGVPLER